MDKFDSIKNKSIDDFAFDYEHGDIGLWYDYALMVVHNTVKNFKKSINELILKDITVNAATDAVIKAYNGRQGFNSANYSKVTPWLGTIARNCTMDELKKYNRISMVENTDIDSPIVKSADKPVLDIIRKQSWDFNHELFLKFMDIIDSMKIEDKLIMLCMLDNPNSYVTKAKDILAEIDSPLAGLTDSAIKQRARRARLSVVEKSGVDPVDFHDNFTTDYTVPKNQIPPQTVGKTFSEEDKVWLQDRLIEYIFVSMK